MGVADTTGSGTVPAMIAGLNSVEAWGQLCEPYDMLVKWCMMVVSCWGMLTAESGPGGTKI